MSVRERAVELADHGRREDRPELVARRELDAFGRSSGVKSIRSSMRDALAIVGRRLGGKRLRRRVPLAGHVALRHRPLLDRPDRLAGGAIEHVEPALLGRLRDGLDHAAVDGDVGENRRARDVHVPDAVVDELVVPLALAGLQVDARPGSRRTGLARDDGRRSSRRSAFPPAGRRAPSSSSTADLRPHAGVAGVGPRVLLPRVVAELRPAAEWCGRSTAACRCGRRSRGRSP